MTLPPVNTQAGPVPVSTASDCMTPAPPAYCTNITITFFGAIRTPCASTAGAPRLPAVRNQVPLFASHVQVVSKPPVKPTWHDAVAIPPTRACGLRYLNSGGGGIGVPPAEYTWST